MAFSVRLGFIVSSIKYRSRRDGKAKNRRIIAGIMVQIVSICWASRIVRHVRVLIIMATIA